MRSSRRAGLHAPTAGSTRSISLAAPPTQPPCRLPPLRLRPVRSGCTRLYLLLCSTLLLACAGVVHWHGLQRRAAAPPKPRSLTRAAAAPLRAGAPPLPPPTYRWRSAQQSALPPLARTARGAPGLEFREPEARYPAGAWAWAPPLPPLPGLRPAHQCLPLNSDFSRPTATTAAHPVDGRGRLQRTLEYGHWRVRWPRFAAPEHAAWFSAQNLVSWRRDAHECVAQYEERRAQLRQLHAQAANASRGSGRRGGGGGAAPPLLPPSLLSPAPAVRPALAAQPQPGQAAFSQGDMPPPGGWAAPSDTSDHWLYFCEPRFTQGRVILTDAVKVSEAPGGHDCGPDSDLEVLVSNAAANDSAPVPVPGPLFWGVIPATWTWQHWCENTLPKLAQAEAGLVWEEVWGEGNGGAVIGSSGSGGQRKGFQGAAPRLLEGGRRRAEAATSSSSSSSGSGSSSNSSNSTPPAPPHHPFWHQATANQELLSHRFPIVAKLYTDALTMAEPIDVREGPISTPRLVHACAAPPLHPFLWQLGQASVLGLGPPPPLRARRKLVYCSRRDARSTEHPGRLLVNEEAVVALLERLCAGARKAGSSGCEGVAWFNHRDFNNNVTAMAAFFEDAIGLISPHGGCLTNVNLMPCNAGVLEIMPLIRGELVPTEPHWHMLYMQAAFLEMRYWMLPVEAEEGTYDDMSVPLQYLERIVVDMLSEDAPRV